MAMLAVALAVGAPILLMAEKDFFHVPGADEFRFQEIVRADSETGWPFSVDSGFLGCVWGTGRRMGYFFEFLREDEDSPVPRFVVLSANPLELAFAPHADVFVSGQTLEQRITLVAPYAAMAHRLCDQPKGSRIQSGEL